MYLSLLLASLHLLGVHRSRVAPEEAARAPLGSLWELSETSGGLKETRGNRKKSEEEEALEGHQKALKVGKKLRKVLVSLLEVPAASP